MVEQKQFLYNQQQCILKVMICTGEDDPLGYLLAEQLLMRASPQYQQNPFAEALETNISPFAKCIHVGLLVHPNHVENENLKSLVQRFQSTNLLSTVIGDALEEKPEELSKKLDHYQVIVSASLRNSILHPHTQYRTEMNLIDTCIYMSRQTYGCFKAFVPCQFMFDFTKFNAIDWNLQMGNQTFIWSFIQQKQLVLQKLREHSIPYMAIHCGLCTDLLVEFITYSDVRSVNQQQQSIQLYLDCDFSDVNVDCTTIKDVAQITADKISKIGTDVPFSTQEWSFSGDRINLKQISESLNWQLIKLGSLQDCQLKINQLVQQIQQNDNHGLDTEKYRLSAFLTKYLIGKNCALLSEMTPKTKLVEKGFQFENCVNFTKQLYTPLQYTSQQGFY